MPNTKLNFNQFIFEVTRRCNLECPHCARGEAQNIDLSMAHIDTTIAQMRRVENVSLTGGEPFLVPDTIKHILEQLKKNDVECYSFSVVTNGTILSEDIAEIFNDIGFYCRASQYKKKNRRYPMKAEIEISDTPYHNNNPQEALEFYSKHCNGNVRVHIQDYTKYGNDESNKYEMAYSGRAKSLDNSFGCSSLCYQADMSGNNIKCKVQLNSTGDIALSELVEFETEDTYNMGCVEDRPIIDMLKHWNRVYLLDCTNAWHRETAIKALESGRMSLNDRREAREMIYNINEIEENLQEESGLI